LKEGIMEESKEPVEVLSNTTRIVMWAMAIVMVCISVVAVIIVLNERSTQLNADRQEEQNEILAKELSCLRDPAFESDKADSELAIITARGLAAVAIGDDEVLASLSQDLLASADQLEQKLDARELSITACSQP
jgi:hypothetical protein